MKVLEERVKGERTEKQEIQALLDTCGTEGKFLSPGKSDTIYFRGGMLSLF